MKTYIKHRGEQLTFKHTFHINVQNQCQACMQNSKESTGKNVSFTAGHLSIPHSFILHSVNPYKV
jgi:hypothetical protein